MPNQRRPGQTFIGAQLDKDLLAALDKARGFKDRSLFVREAIAEKLRSQKFTIPDSLVHAPDRSRKQSEETGPTAVEPRPAKYPKPKRKKNLAS